MTTSEQILVRLIIGLLICAYANFAHAVAVGEGYLQPHLAIGQTRASASAAEQRIIQISLERYYEAVDLHDDALIRVELARLRSQLASLAKRNVELKIQVRSMSDYNLTLALDKAFPFKRTADLAGTSRLQKFVHACYVLSVCVLNPANTIANLPDALPPRTRLESFESGAGAAP